MNYRNTAFSLSLPLSLPHLSLSLYPYTPASSNARASSVIPNWLYNDANIIRVSVWCGANERTFEYERAAGSNSWSIWRHSACLSHTPAWENSLVSVSEVSNGRAFEYSAIEGIMIIFSNNIISFINIMWLY